MMAYFDEVFRDTDSYFKKLAERIFKEMEEIEKAIRSGKLQGEWEVKPIEKPGVKGYVARGRFQFGEPLTLPRHAINEVREPLTDVFEDKDQVKLYVELPGVDKNEIQLDVTDGRAEVKARNFHKFLDLPTKDVEFEKASANYKNGVLEVTIPKMKKTAREEKKKPIKIE
jgi:HSP20 family molecular chaperone IbpA